MEPVYVDANDLPCDNDCNFTDSKIVLPTPREVRARTEEPRIDPSRAFRPDPVKFPELGIIVKWGTDVTIAEGQCLWFLRRYLSQEVPVPEIYGWKQEGGQTFLYMELVDGETLEDRWEGLDENERVAIAQQLREMVSSWRRIRPASNADAKSPSPIPLSQIGGQALRDIMFYDGQSYPAGPFANMTTFHDWFATLASPTWARKPPSESPRYSYPELSGFDDNVEVVFTHNDLFPSNIHVSKPGDGSARVVAVIDWHQSGWYPEPWERLKAQSVAHPGSDWRTEYVSKVLDDPEYNYYYSWEYVSMATI